METTRRGLIATASRAALLWVAICIIKRARGHEAV